MSEPVVYVVGHKHPDTDSICSAIGYARLRQLQGLAGVKAARAGNLNRQTEFVLNRLVVTVPTLLTDVSPRVRDLVHSPAVTISGDTPLAMVLEQLYKLDLRMLPVTDEEQRPQGLMMLKRAAEGFLLPADEGSNRRVLTSLAALQECLQATALYAVDEQELEDLELYVGAMAFESFAERLAHCDPRRLLVVTGDRQEIQAHAVNLGVRALVITGGGTIAPELLATARQRQVTVLSTSFDTATAAWRARLSTPVHCLMERNCPTVGLLDCREDLRLKLLYGGCPGVLVLDSAGRVTAVATKSDLLVETPLKLILVDHNELSQAVPGADRVEILEVIDHHRLGNFHTERPILFINQPLGSTCSLVASLYRQAGLQPEQTCAGLLLAGLLSDTVLLKSPTTTDIDRELAVWLGELAQLDPQSFGQQMFAAGSVLSAYDSMEELILSDFKEYRAGERLFGVGQVEVVGFEEFYGVKQQLAKELAHLRRSRGMAAVGLLVTDIVRETSLLLVDGEADLPYLIGYPELETGLYELQGVLSRKKQLVPHLLKVLQG
ncbi:MAG: inorganic diphosphatase [Desulfuromonadales bacterium C00003096]|nr:MAG: inorganic diphosphatase [Desulfuromonadales bacterium C00003096]